MRFLKCLYCDFCLLSCLQTECVVVSGLYFLYYFLGLCFLYLLSWLCVQVAVAHTIGHVAATVSMSKVAVSFTHIIKSGEPAFSVLVSRFLLGETFPVPVYLSLLPIIGGCALAAVTELNFNMTGEKSYSITCLN